MNGFGVGQRSPHGVIRCIFFKYTNLEIGAGCKFFEPADYACQGCEMRLTIAGVVVPDVHVKPDGFVVCFGEVQDFFMRGQSVDARAPRKLCGSVMTCLNSKSPTTGMIAPSLLQIASANFSNFPK